MTSRRPRSIAVRLHRALLVAYPGAFRRRFGADMQRMFEARLDTVRKRGAGAAAAFAAMECADVVWGGALERLAGKRAADLRVRPAMFNERTPLMSWHDLRADIRFALRLMGKAPLTTALAVGALALGIGATSAMFTAVDALVLRPLPYADPGRLVMIWSDNTRTTNPRNPVSPADFLDVKAATQSFDRVEAMQSFLAPAPYTDRGEPVAVQTSTVSPGMFALLGRDALVGRTLREGDQHEIVLSYGFWQRYYGGDRNVLGRQVHLDTGTGVIVGVMPKDFEFPYRTMLGPSGFSRAQSADVWQVMLFQGRFYLNDDRTVARGARFLGLVGRLKPGVGVTQARADVQRVASVLAGQYPASNTGWGASVTPLLDETVGGMRPALLLLLGGVGLLWLIACANVANLLLARNTARRNELALRRALGASEWRLMRQTLVESLVLAVAASVAGGVLMTALLPVLVSLAPPDTPRLATVGPSLAVYGFVIALTCLTAVLTAVLPARLSPIAGGDLQNTLKDGGRAASPGRAAQRTRAALVVVEVALAVMLTTGATLLVRSFVSVLGVNPGFAVDHLLTLQINIPPSLTAQDARVAYYDDLFSRINAIPGVAASGGTTRVPLGSTNVTTTVSIEGREIPVGQLPEVELRRALGDYFTAMSMPLLRGRGFTAADSMTSPGVCVINQTMASKLFPGEDAVGRHLKMGANPVVPWLTVVGIVGDVRHGSLEEAPRPELYVTGRQNPPVAPYLTVRASGDAAALAGAVQSAVRAIDPNTPIFDLKTMEAIRGESVSQRRFVLTLASVFGVLALVLAACGVFGVMSLVVSERTQELGVRVALGATREDVLRLVFGQVLRLGATGIVIGLAGAAVLAPLLASQLFGVRPIDAMTFTIVPLALLVAAMLAGCQPARRALQVDPVEALRKT